MRKLIFFLTQGKNGLISSLVRRRANKPKLAQEVAVVSKKCANRHERRSKMYQDKLDSAVSIINEHNAALGDFSPNRIDSEKFINCLKLSGATSEDRLKKLSYEDILECLPDVFIEGLTPKKLKPVLIAKDIAKIFREKEEANTEEKRPVSKVKADRLTIPELIAALDPEDLSSPVTERLRKISRNQKFIVYSQGRTIDVETTKKLLDEIKQGFSGRDSIEVNGKFFKVYNIGELPEAYAEENPLYHNRPLRPDGTCDQLNRSWEGVPFQVRQFIYLGVESKEIAVSREKAHDILDLVVSNNFEKIMKTLRQRYTKTSLLFDEKEKTGKLPSLKITLSFNSSNDKIKPLDNGAIVKWNYKSCD